MLYRLRVKLVSYDRPGYGSSTRRKGRSVADAARDVEVIADDLGLDRFSIVGRSGGGPHALACAALLPERVVRTAVLGSVAPPDADGLDWFDGMTDDNADAYLTAGQDSSSLAKQLRQRVRRAVKDPRSILGSLREEMTESDLLVVQDVALQRMMAETFKEALSTGANGWIDDVLALRRDWGFDLDAIKGPVWLWHGEQDNFAPVSHSRWLASRIPDARIEVHQEKAHFAGVEALMELLPWLIDWPHPLDEDKKSAARVGSGRRRP